MGIHVGTLEGCDVGIHVGTVEGCDVGIHVGTVLGMLDGTSVGCFVGKLLGMMVGIDVGIFDGGFSGRVKFIQINNIKKAIQFVKRKENPIVSRPFSCLLEYCPPAKVLGCAFNYTCQNDSSVSFS